MGTGVRPRVAWALVGGLATIFTLGVAGAPSAAADDVPQYCSINISTGDYWCSSDPAQSRQLARAALDSGGSILLGRFFDSPDRNIQDSYFNVYAAGACDTSSDLDYTLGSVPSGWNDRVSSFQGYNNCQVKIWKDGNATGASLGPLTYANYLGAMDNQTSSITFY
jgi:hypothetical protein